MMEYLLSQRLKDTHQSTLGYLVPQGVCCNYPFGSVPLVYREKPDRIGLIVPGSNLTGQRYQMIRITDKITSTTATDFCV